MSGVREMSGSRQAEMTREELGKRLRLNRMTSKEGAEQEAGKFRGDLGKTKHWLDSCPKMS